MALDLMGGLRQHHALRLLPLRLARHDVGTYFLLLELEVHLNCILESSFCAAKPQSDLRDVAQPQPASSNDAHVKRVTGS